MTLWLLASASSALRGIESELDTLELPRSQGLNTTNGTDACIETGEPHAFLLPSTFRAISRALYPLDTHTYILHGTKYQVFSIVWKCLIQLEVLVVPYAGTERH